MRSEKKQRKSRHVDWNGNKQHMHSEEDLYIFLDNLIHPPFLLILDGIQDPHNLGACLRSAEGAGVDAVIIPKDRAVSITDTVREIASGAAERIPVYQVTNLSRCLNELKQSGIWLVGTSDKAKTSIYDIDLNGSLGLVMGGEGKGLRKLTEENCDFLAKIPMYGSVECLNVSVSTGICLFEAVRQRIQKK